MFELCRVGQRHSPQFQTPIVASVEIQIKLELVLMLHSSLPSPLLCILRFVITIGPVSELYAGIGYCDIKSLIYK